MTENSADSSQHEKNTITADFSRLEEKHAVPTHVEQTAGVGESLALNTIDNPLKVSFILSSPSLSSIFILSIDAHTLRLTAQLPRADGDQCPGFCGVARHGRARGLVRSGGSRRP